MWLLPLDKATAAAKAIAKAAFPVEAIGAHGSETYHRIVDFMTPLAAAVVAESAWYLSIVAVSPSAQGQGTGARLLQSTSPRATYPLHQEGAGMMRERRG